MSNVVERKSLSSYTMKQLEECFKQKGLPGFRSKQLFSWPHEKQVTHFDEMTNLPATLRQELQQEFFLDGLEQVEKQQSADGTVKYLFGLQDKNRIETVLMQHKHGNSLCVSSQVGCRMGCRFCASAPGGLLRSLSAGEIAAQVYAVTRDSGQRVSHIVLMGIGEPLDNFDNVMDFLSIITDPAGANVSMRNISLSTCGLVPGIRRLAEKRLGLTLSVSLHGASNSIRSGMMPVNDAYPIEELVAACEEYQKTTGRRVSYEYAMVRGVNDTPEDAKRLAGLFKGKQVHINLIPVNPVDGSPYGTSDHQNIVAFKEQLNQLGLNATVRRRLGADISAACGQLRAAREGME